MRITLTQEQYEELKTLEDGQTLEITYKGIYGWIEPNEYGNIEYEGRKYLFNFFCPNEVKMIVK